MRRSSWESATTSTQWPISTLAAMSKPSIMLSSPRRISRIVACWRRLWPSTWIASSRSTGLTRLTTFWPISVWLLLFRTRQEQTGVLRDQSTNHGKTQKLRWDIRQFGQTLRDHHWKIYEKKWINGVVLYWEGKKEGDFRQIPISLRVDAQGNQHPYLVKVQGSHEDWIDLPHDGPIQPILERPLIIIHVSDLRPLHDQAVI